MPAPPPISDRTMPSVSTCRTTRRRAAPIASRTAISRFRDAARASIRFATFAHAMSSTQATAPNNTKSARRVSGGTNQS